MLYTYLKDNHLHIDFDEDVEFECEEMEEVALEVLMNVIDSKLNNIEEELKKGVENTKAYWSERVGKF